MSPPLEIGPETAAARLVHGLRDGGVGAAFGLDDPRGYFAALRRSDVGAHVVHDERAGGFMADGYARATGRPVACSGISAAGAVNLAPALLEAWGSSSPLVAVVGEFLPEQRGRRAFQEAAHASFLGAGLSKETVEVRHPSEAYAGARYAAERASSGRPRPVLLLVSDAVLWAEAGAAEEAPAERRSPARPSADPAAVRLAAERLAGAERPVVLAGAGVHASGAHDELLELARRQRLPVATSMSGKGAVPEDDPVAIGVTGAYTSGRGGRGELSLELLLEADLILVVGSDLDALTVALDSWPVAGTELIRVDVDAEEIRTHPGLRLHGDARAVLRQLLAEPADPPPPEREARLEAIAAARATRDAAIAAADEREPRGSVWPGEVMRELGARLRPRDRVVADASYSSAWALDRISQTRPGRQVIAPRGVGTLGWGLPAGIGVKLAQPAAAVTVVSGDGALFFSMPELETAARWDLDLTLVLLRNYVYGSQRHSNILGQDADYDDLHFRLGGIDHCALARATGWSAELVTEPGQFAGAYEAARAVAGPSLIEVAVDPEHRPALLKFDRMAAAAGVPA